MSRETKCFNLANFGHFSLALVAPQRTVFLENFSAEQADTAAKSLERGLEFKKDTPKDLADFLRTDPETISNPDSKIADLKGSLSEKAGTSIATVDAFIDALVANYDGSPEAKSLFERDLIASFQENGGIAAIKKVLGMKSLHIKQIEVTMYGGKINVSGLNKAGSGFSMLDFKLKSSLREKAEQKYGKIIRNTQQDLTATESGTGKGLTEDRRHGPELATTAAIAGATPPFRLENNKLRTDGPAAKLPPDEEAPEEEPPTRPDPLADLDEKSRTMVKEGAERAQGHKRMMEENDRRGEQQYYSQEKLEQLINKEILIDKDVYKKWTGLDVSDPEIFKHISNIDELENLIAQEPFKWSLGKLHKAIKDGWIDQILDFDDLIDEEGLGLKDDNDFMEEYLKLVEKFDNRTATDEDGKKLRYYNKIMAQAEKIMEAVKNLRIEEIAKEGDVEARYEKIMGSAKETMLASTSPTAIPTVEKYYSLSSLGAEKLLDQEDYESKPEKEKTVLGIDSKLFKGWKASLVKALEDYLRDKHKVGQYGSKDRFGLERSKIDRLDAATLLKMVGEIYGYEKLAKEGYITIVPGKEPRLALTSLPTEFDPAIAKADDSKLYALFQSLQWERVGFAGNAFNYDRNLLKETSVERMDDSGKVDTYLQKIFDKNHIGEAIDGGEGQVMDITLADGLHTTVYKDHFKSYLTGESAYLSSKSQIWKAAESDATAKGESREQYGKYALPYSVELINTFIKLGNLNSKALFGQEKKVPLISEEDIKNQTISEDQIKAAQMGSTIEWSQSAKFDELADIEKSNPMLYQTVRQLFWNNPGLGNEKRQEIMKAIKKIDLGGLGFYVKTDQDANVDTFGAGYTKSFELPYGLSLNVMAAGFKSQETSGAVVGGGVGGSHKLPEGWKVNWSVTAGAGFSSLGVGPFVTASASFDYEVSDAYDLSVGAFVGSDLLTGVKAGVTFGAKADVQRSYDRQLGEKYHKMGFDELNKVLQNPGVSIDEKAAAIENNPACGPLIAKMTNVFAEMQQKLGRPVSKNMRQDLMLQGYNTILNHMKLHHDVEWTPEVINSIGVTVEISPNLFKTFEALIGGLISFNIKGKTYVIPIAAPGRPELNQDDVLTQKMLEKLKERLARAKGTTADKIEITPGMLSEEGLLVRVPGKYGFEYRATTTKETFAEASLEKKDETDKAIGEAFDDAYISFNRDSDPTSFTLDVRGYGNEPMEKTQIILNVDPKLKPYIDIVGDKQNKFKIRFKEGFKQFGRFLVSRQDIIAPMRYKGSPRLTKITLKADMTPDSVLEQMNNFTGLYKYPGYQVAEKGSQKEDNSLWANQAEYQKYLASNPGKYLQLNEKDLSEAEKADAIMENAAIKEHRQLWGIDHQEQQEGMRSHAELDDLVTGFLSTLSKSPDYRSLYNAIMGDKLATQHQTNTIMKGLQKYTLELGKPELNAFELEYTKNLFSIHTFTDVTKYYVEDTDTEEVASKKLTSLKNVLKRRINFFGRIADQMFANTTEGFDPKVRRGMVKYLKEMMTRKVEALTTEDIRLGNLSNIDRGSLGQFLGSMAGRLANKRQGRLADLDTYGTIGPDDAQNFMAFGIDNFSIHAEDVEGQVARAIVEIEYPYSDYNPDLRDAKYFLNQPLAVQVGIQAEKFLTGFEIAELNKIKQGETGPELEPTYKKFYNLVQTIHNMQMEISGPTVTNLPEYKNVTMVVQPLTVKDFFFERCGNYSWGVDGGVAFYAKDAVERPVFAGTRVEGRIALGTESQVSYYTFSLMGAGERKITNKPPPPTDKEKDFKGTEHDEPVEGKDGEPVYNTNPEGGGVTNEKPGTPTAAGSDTYSPNRSEPLAPASTPTDAAPPPSTGGGATSSGGPGKPE